MSSKLDFYMLFAGLGMFLFGMSMLEDSLKKIAGPRLKGFLKHNTNTPLKGIFTGTFVTAILQSSSLVSLMVLTFVGAGLMTMTSAVGVILGANLGTTVTGWFFSMIGFKLNIKNVAFILLGVGALIHTFYSNKTKLKNISLTLIGIALLFSGLDFMKTSISDFGKSFDVKQYLDFGVYGFFVVGFILTAIIQSSSASMVIVLSALNANLISFEAAAGIVIGSDLGTTITVFLGTIKATGDKKRVALSHFLFNLITAVIALIIAGPLISFVGLVGITDPLVGIVFFHSSFNVLGIMLFLPFIGKFSEFLSHRFEENEEKILFHLNHVQPSDSPEMVYELAEQEVKTFIKRSVYLSLDIINLDSNLSKKLELESTFTQGLKGISGYLKLKDSQNEILKFCIKSLSQNETRPEITEKFTLLIDSIRRSGNALKNIKDVTYNLDEYRGIAIEQIESTYKEVERTFEDSFIELFEIMNNENPSNNWQQFERQCIESREKLFSLVYKQVATDHVENVLITNLLNLIREVFGSIKQFSRSIQVLRAGKIHKVEITSLDNSSSPQ